MIAKVEPLTTARALRGPFDYLLGPSMDGVGVGSMLVVPFARRRILGVVVEVVEHSDVAPDKLVEPLSALESDVPPELVTLGLWVAHEYVSTPARGLALVLPPGTGTGSGRRTRPRRSLLAALTAAGRDVPSETGHGLRLGERQRAALHALRAGPARVSDLASTTGCDHAGARRLEERGLVTLEWADQAPRRPASSVIGARPVIDALTDAQATALHDVIEAMDAPVGTDRRQLLHGVTGSGKTEVYLRAVAATIDRSKTAIVLVPEIALTPQTAGRFVERFGDTVAILHSKLTARERFDEWSRLRSGAAKVCVGPRSAVFAPLSDIGLIVVDEEHDGSYKQEGDPRYDARHVAERRAAGADCVLLAGSATPRPESFRRFRRLVLSERVDGRGMPPVEVVGMAGVKGVLHQRTRDALSEVARAGEKAIVLLNRRGWSNFLTCGECGRVWECPDCDVSLVLHRSAGEVSCHHCGHSEVIPGRCPECRSVSLTRHGTGTEQLGVELERLVAPLPVFRLDADTVAKEGVAATLERFEAAESGGVLVGTQMVAKGHDFADVTLGVVLDADATLRFPDFRAEERTFALVAQLAGRSGRGPRGGRVVVQALDPAARALQHAATHDSLGFLEGELERRGALAYPPDGHLIRVVCSSTDAGPEHRAAQALAKRIAPPGASVLGPVPLFRRQGRERAQLVIKGRDREAGIVAVRRAVEEAMGAMAKEGVNVAVDVDPQ
ncbi:MAG: replication restart helicase PriA [Thermoleophilaceae bacterium]